MELFLDVCVAFKRLCKNDQNITSFTVLRPVPHRNMICNVFTSVIHIFCWGIFYLCQNDYNYTFYFLI